MCVCVGVEGGVVGARALERACAFSHVALITQHATRHHAAICGLSGSTKFFDIIS